MTSSNIANHASFSAIRYAQCWEDADILLDALDIQPGQICLSIASAGDNTLAMLARGPERVIAMDLNPAQLACLELRVAAYRELEHDKLLVLIGSRPGRDRITLYQRCRSLLSHDARRFWDSHTNDINLGIGGAGKFERYFALFRNWVLPLVHTKQRVGRLLSGGDRSQREAFYDSTWDSWRWRAMFNLFFSRFVMGHMGRDPSFFRYVQGSVANRILSRTRHALTALNPADNPYLQWILTGQHTTALPYALRLQNFDAIRNNLDRLEWHCLSVENFLNNSDYRSFDRFNLSDIFEYMSTEHYHFLLSQLAKTGAKGARLAYWNMLTPRHRPEEMSDQLHPLSEQAQQLFEKDKAFFYSRFVIEEIAK